MNPALLSKPISAAHESSGPIVVLGFVNDAGAHLSVLCVDGDGQFLVLDASKMRVDWRYDWQFNRWVDVSYDVSEDLMDYEEEDGEPETEETDHGSTTIP